MATMELHNIYYRIVDVNCKSIEDIPEWVEHEHLRANLSGKLFYKALLTHAEGLPENRYDGKVKGEYKQAIKDYCKKKINELSGEGNQKIERKINHSSAPKAAESIFEPFPPREKFKNSGEFFRNDVCYNKLFSVADNAYAFTLFPKSKFWRFGLRFSKTKEVRFDLAPKEPIRLSVGSSSDWGSKFSYSSKMNRVSTPKRLYLSRIISFRIAIFCPYFFF